MEHAVVGGIMRMDKYSNAAYGSAGLTAFFASKIGLRWWQSMAWTR